MTDSANRKSHMRFRLVPQLSTLDDPGRPWTAKTHTVAEKMRLLEPTVEIWMKIDPYMQRQKCRPMTLVSGNTDADIRKGSFWLWHQTRVGLSTTAIFGDLIGYFFGNFRDQASNIIWRYATPCRLWLVAKWMTLNDLQWLFHVKIRFRPAFLDSERLNFENNCVKSNRHKPTLHAAVM